VIAHHPAYPTNTQGICDPTTQEQGLTKRELIAAMVIQGVQANPSSDEWTHAEIARFAVRSADALIEELSK